MEGKIRESQSLAQIPPDQAKKDATKRISFYTYFKQEMNERCLRRHQTLWRAILMRGLRSALYYCGHQILIPRSNGFGFEIRHLRGTDHPIYVMNKLRGYSDDTTSQWVQVDPEVKFAVLAESQRVQERAMDTINSLDDYFDHLHFTELLIQKVAKFGQFTGNYTGELFFDEDAKRGLEFSRDYEDAELPEETWYQCAECDSSGPMSNAQGSVLDPQSAPASTACPDCGSPYVAPIKLSGVQMENLVGEGFKESGEVVLKFSPSWSHRFSLTTGDADSPWRYFEEDEPRERVEDQFGKLDSSADKTEWSEDEHLHCERIMRRADRARFSTLFGAEDDDDCVLVQRFWYQPEALRNLQLKEDCVLPNGETIPAGTRLSDYWPDGVCVKTVPGSSRFLDVYPDNHAKRFISGIYGLNPGQQVGEGTTDAVEGQRGFNLMHSGEFKHTQRTLMPTVLLTGGAFKSSRIFNLPDGVHFINKADLPEDGNIQKTFAMLEPPQVSPRVPLLMERLDAMMQVGTKSFNGEGDFPGTQNNTATAARIAVARNAGNNSLYLALYAGWLKEVKLRALELAQQHYGEMRLILASDPVTNRQISKVIKSVDLRHNVMAWVKPGSWLPDLQLERRVSYKEGVDIWLTLKQAGADSPMVVRQLDEIYGTDFGAQKLRERVEACEEALQTMEDALDQAMRMPMDPAEYLYSLAPVDAYENGHEIKIVWWRDWLSSPEGRHASDVLRQAAKMQIDSEDVALQMERARIAGAAQVGSGVVAPPQMTGMQPEQMNPPAPAPAPGIDAGQDSAAFPSPSTTSLMANGQPPGPPQQQVGGM